MPTCYTPSDRAYSDALMSSSCHCNCPTFPTGAMCATCGFECDPGDSGCEADAAHAAFDPAHDPMWHPDPVDGPTPCDWDGGPDTDDHGHPI